MSFFLVCGFIAILGLEYTILFMAIFRCGFGVMLCGQVGLAYSWVGFFIHLFLCEWDGLYLVWKYIGLLVILIMLL